MATTNNIPVALNKVEIYINGSNSLAGIGEVELPNIELATVTTEQIGLTSEYDAVLDGHYKKLEAKIKMDTVDNTLITFNNDKPILLECKGVIQVMNKQTHGFDLLGVDVTMKGLIKKFDGLKLKNGSKLETSFDLSVSYYELVIEGNQIVQIDVFNNISNINGHNNSKVLALLGII
ncbi:phage major tail tube protein [Streptobacillus moniliformis]|uniref:phage major tail tube protein n=1 Tax=Streptobacillus moniliformis TaxID=34105 RepID=UPI0007E4A304|nr:phage major tail tube protein [Streptobacillus moniliformis]QXW65659.1 phage major tail tube protein [Streptobacillus moniliformis]